MVLHGHEAVPAVLARHVQRLGKLPRRHAAGAQIAHLAGAHQRVQRIERFFERGGRVPAVNLVQVDVVHVEPPQRIFARLDDVLAAQAAAVGSRPHGAVHLGGDHDVVALRHLPQPVAGNGLAQPHRVHVGGVEEGDAGLQRRGEVLACFLLAQGPVPGPRPVGLLAAAVTHASKADSRHRHAGAPELRILHRVSNRFVTWPWGRESKALQECGENFSRGMMRRRRRGCQDGPRLVPSKAVRYSGGPSNPI